MTAARQDAWNQDEDLLLAEVVLRHIRDGGTQLQAFEEVGRRLTRTAAACGFRWNSFVRKQYKTGIELAKKHRKEKRKGTAERETAETAPQAAKIEETIHQKEEISLKRVIELLQQLEEDYRAEHEKQTTEDLKKKVAFLERNVARLEEEKSTLQASLQTVEEDYSALIEIMERARKMVVFQDDERNRKVKFQMDRNGNLERIEK